MPHLALYQPEIPQNLGTLMRTAACLGFHLDIIGPTGFPFSERQLKRSAMDYIQYLDHKIHVCWEDFAQHYSGRRILLMSTQAPNVYTDFAFHPDDILLMGRESDGVDSQIEAALEKSRLRIPMRPECRSLNVAIAAGMVMGEMTRQLKSLA